MPRPWLDRITGRPKAPRIYLHIGAMKTGTTFLQGLMSANQEALLRAGYLFPGDKWAEQSLAVRDILFDSDDPRLRALVDGQWDKMLDAIRHHDGPASILSMEFLSYAEEDQARRVVESLDGLDVHIVLTVRDAKSAIPAQWQTGCRNGRQITYQRLVRSVRALLDGEEPEWGAAKFFLRTQGIARMLDVWTPLVGPKNVHVITVPPKGSDPMLLWRRFAQVVGVDPSVATKPPPESNLSLGHASSELLRRVNIELGEVHRIDYNRVVKAVLARRILAERASLEQPVRLNRRGLNLGARWNQLVRDAIKTHGVKLVGSLDELPVDPPGDEVPVDLPRPTDEEIVEAATTARDGLLRLWGILCREAELPPPPPAEGVPTTVARWADAEVPVVAAVSEVTALARTCIEIQREYGFDVLW
ncbi:MAG: hypothetical protein U0R78_02860 [Nocardioidaceae bacterium]